MKLRVQIFRQLSPAYDVKLTTITYFLVESDELATICDQSGKEQGRDRIVKAEVL